MALTWNQEMNAHAVNNKPIHTFDILKCGSYMCHRRELKFDSHQCSLWWSLWFVTMDGYTLKRKTINSFISIFKKKVPQKGPTVKPVACTDRLTILLVFLSIPIQSWNKKENKNSYINALDLFTYTWTTARHQYKCKLTSDR